ncbi:MAG TPA: hypothetical protein VFM54_01405 [Micromonosporaceae bacterium]|nr:hypothetical protein [Micromonosporaceae bacterium]
MTHPLLGLFLIVLIGSSTYALGRIAGRQDRLDAYRCGRQDGTNEEWNRQRAYIQATLRHAFNNRVTVAFSRSLARELRSDSHIGTTYRSRAAVARAAVPAPRQESERFATPGPAALPQHGARRAELAGITRLSELEEIKEPAREG